VVPDLQWNLSHQIHKQKSDHLTQARIPILVGYSQLVLDTISAPTVTAELKSGKDWDIMIVCDGPATFIFGNNSKSSTLIFYAILHFFIHCLGLELKDGEIYVKPDTNTIQWSGTEICLLDGIMKKYDVSVFQDIKIYL